MKFKKIIGKKKALSEIVSYVLLIVIAIGLAGLVYVWLVNYLPSEKADDKCNPETSIIIKDYNCSSGKINLTVKNQGMFSIRGFFARASNSSDENKIPTTMLNCTDELGIGKCLTPGRFEFTPNMLKPRETQSITFNYSDIQTIKRIQLQPYVQSNVSNRILLCENIITVPLENCN